MNMSNEMKTAFAAATSGHDVTVETTPTVFSVMNQFTSEESEALANLLSVRFKPREIEAIAKSYPSASAAELFVIAKMKEFAEDERIASVWRARGNEWKLSTLSYARQVFHEVDAIRKNAQRAIAKLADEVPLVKHEDVIKWLQTRNALDCSSNDERILEVKKIFAAQ
jgi:hypothetical protein